MKVFIRLAAKAHIMSDNLVEIEIECAPLSQATHEELIETLPDLYGAFDDLLTKQALLKTITQ